MGYFRFERLITKYGRRFDIIIPAMGEYVGGVWKEGKPVIEEEFGAILSLSETKLYQLGGTLSAQDRHLYMNHAIRHPLEGVKIKFHGNIYHIEENRSRGNEEFTGVYAYTLRWVSAIDQIKK